MLSIPPGLAFKVFFALVMVWHTFLVPNSVFWWIYLYPENGTIVDVIMWPILIAVPFASFLLGVATRKPYLLLPLIYFYQIFKWIFFIIVIGCILFCLYPKYIGAMVMDSDSFKWTDGKDTVYGSAPLWAGRNLWEEATINALFIGGFFTVFALITHGIHYVLTEFKELVQDNVQNKKKISDIIQETKVVI